MKIPRLEQVHVERRLPHNLVSAANQLPSREARGACSRKGDQPWRWAGGSGIRTRRNKCRRLTFQLAQDSVEPTFQIRGRLKAISGQFSHHLSSQFRKRRMQLTKNFNRKRLT